MWGDLNQKWASPGLSDEIVDFVTYWSDKAELSKRRLLSWIGLLTGKYYEWVKRYGKGNQHNDKIPKLHWLLESERQAIVECRKATPKKDIVALHRHRLTVPK